MSPGSTFYYYRPPDDPDQEDTEFEVSDKKSGWTLEVGEFLSWHNQLNFTQAHDGSFLQYNKFCAVVINLRLGTIELVDHRDIKANTINKTDDKN